MYRVIASRTLSKEPKRSRSDHYPNGPRLPLLCRLLSGVSFLSFPCSWICSTLTMHDCQMDYPEYCTDVVDSAIRGGASKKNLKIELPSVRSSHRYSPLLHITIATSIYLLCYTAAGPMSNADRSKLPVGNSRRIEFSLSANPLLLERGHSLSTLDCLQPFSSQSFPFVLLVYPTVDSS